MNKKEIFILLSLFSMFTWNQITVAGFFEETKIIKQSTGPVSIKDIKKNDLIAVTNGKEILYAPVGHVTQFPCKAWVTFFAGDEYIIAHPDQPLSIVKTVANSLVREKTIAATLPSNIKLGLWSFRRNKTLCIDTITYNDPDYTGNAYSITLKDKNLFPLITESLFEAPY